jgi:hypothetical protein
LKEIGLVFKMNKKSMAAIGAAVGIVVAGAAYAWVASTGHGSGNTQVSGASAVTVTEWQTVVAPGDIFTPRTVTISAKNPSTTTSVHFAKVVLGGITAKAHGSSADLTATCGFTVLQQPDKAGGYILLKGMNAFQPLLPTKPATIAAVPNDNSDQTQCLTADLTIAVSAS